MSVVDWTQLPPELLDSIAKKLSIYIDYIRFRAVCHSWRSSVLKTPHHLPCQLPWLMLPEIGSHHHNHHRRAFFSLSENKFHFLNLPEPSHRKRLCGSSHGWLIILDETPNFLVINAITSSRIFLPPLSTFPNVLHFSFAKIGREYSLLSSSGGGPYTLDLTQMRNSFIKKVILSSSPANDNDFIAVAILNQTGDLAFCRKGDQSWSIIDDMRTYCEDVVYHEGLIYAVNSNGMVAVTDVNGPSPTTVSTIQTPRHVSGDMQYLVNSGKELLLITRYLDVESDAEPDVPDIIYRTTGFQVFRLDSDGPRWEKMADLGDRALFLGQNSSLCLRASEFPGCKGNCIYFTDDYSESNYDVVLGDHDLGIFNLGNGRIEPLPSYQRRLNSPPPLWVTPNPC